MLSIHTFRTIPLLLSFCLTFMLLSCKVEKKETVVASTSTLNCDTGLPEDFSFPRTAEYYQPKGTDERQIADYVRRIFEDSKGNMWFGTNGLGVARFDGFELEYFSPDNGMGGYQVTGIMEDKKGNIWISNSGGISVFDGETFNTYSEKDGLPHNWAWCVLEDSKGQIWAGTLEGLCRLDGDSFEPVELPVTKADNPGSHLSINRIMSLVEDSQGNLWIATDGCGVYKYDGKNFENLTKKDGLQDNNVTRILIDSKDNLWFGSMFGGLTKFDGETFTEFSTTNEISNNEVWEVFEDSNGAIWFSSEGFGVYKYYNDELQNYSAKEGLGIPAVQIIYEDSKGHLWIGGGGGLYRKDGSNFYHVSRGTLIDC